MTHQDAVAALIAPLEGASHELVEVKRLMRQCPPRVARVIVEETILCAKVAGVEPSIRSLRWRAKQARRGVFNVHLARQFMTWLSAQQTHKARPARSARLEPNRHESVSNVRAG